MIGLKRHTVEIVESHPNWPRLATAICAKVHDLCGKLVIDVQHVGSTSVPGLPSKPILDVAVGVPNLSVIAKIVDILTEEGYIYRGDAGNNGGHLFVIESETDVRIAHIHVVQYGCEQWLNYLKFRTILRNDPIVRKEYVELKRDLFRRFSKDRKSYTASKVDFISRVLNCNS